MRKTRHSVSGPADLEGLPAVDAANVSSPSVSDRSKSEERDAIIDYISEGSFSSPISNKPRRKTVSGAEEAIISDRNVSPRLGFLSNSMKIKRRKARKRMCDSAEWLYPISKTEGLEAGENNKMMTRTKYTLEALLIANNMSIVKAIVNTMVSTEVEEVGGALLAVFHCNGKGQRLILWAMERELKAEKVPGNLFRGVSLAAFLMSKYFRMSATEYLRSILRPIVKEIKSKDIRIEVDPARLALREDQTETLRENQLKLVHFSKLVFDLLVASLDQFPSVLKNIFNEAQQAINERFPDMGHKFVGSFYFLRFVCPALVAPISYGLVTQDLSPENQRSLILISKVLQNLSNHNLFGEKEPFMMFMNPFISKNSQKMSDCLQALVKKVPDNPTQSGKFFQVSAANEKLKNEALIVLTCSICDHLDDVLTELDHSGQSKLTNVLLDSIKAISPLAKSAGVNINHAALASRFKETRPADQKANKNEVNGDECNEKEIYNALTCMEDSEEADFIPSPARRGVSPQKAGRSPRQFDEEDEEAESLTSGNHGALNGDNPRDGVHSVGLPAIDSTIEPAVKAKATKRLSLQFTGSDSQTRLRTVDSNKDEDSARTDCKTGSDDAGKENRPSVALSLGDIPTREAKDKDKEKEREKMHRKLERVHRVSKAISPRETPVMNPIYNQVMAKMASSSSSSSKMVVDSITTKEEELPRFGKIKPRIGDRNIRERRAATIAVTRSTGDLTGEQQHQQEASTREIRTENILLQYLKDKDKATHLMSMRSENLHHQPAQQPDPETSDFEEKKRYIGSPQIKTVSSPAEHGADRIATENKSLRHELSSLQEAMKREESRRMDAERELAKLRLELENERRMRMEAEQKLEQSYDGGRQTNYNNNNNKVNELLDAERVKRLEAEVRLELERERCAKLREDAIELENERRKRIEAEIRLSVERERWLEDVRQLDNERRSRIEAETILEMERKLRSSRGRFAPSGPTRSEITTDSWEDTPSAMMTPAPPLSATLIMSERRASRGDLAEEARFPSSSDSAAQEVFMDGSSSDMPQEG